MVLTENKKKVAVEAFDKYRQGLVSFAYERIKDYDEAEDIVQDAFVHLLESGDVICEKTVRSFLFTIVRNILIDRLRRMVKSREVYSYAYDSSVKSYNIESEMYAADIRRLEMEKVVLLPSQRRKIYCMSRFEELTANDISKKLNISQRTVEAHLFIGRKEVRKYLRCSGI